MNFNFRPVNDQTHLPKESLVLRGFRPRIHKMRLRLWHVIDTL